MEVVETVGEEKFGRNWQGYSLENEAKIAS